MRTVRRNCGGRTTLRGDAAAMVMGVLDLVGMCVAMASYELSGGGNMVRRQQSGYRGSEWKTPVVWIVW